MGCDEFKVGDHGSELFFCCYHGTSQADSRKKSERRCVIAALKNVGMDQRATGAMARQAWSLLFAGVRCGFHAGVMEPHAPYSGSIRTPCLGCMKCVAIFTMTR